MATILVVDDDRLIRQMVSMVLVHEGFTVVTAEDGENAVSEYRSHEGAIDLLVTDVRMPKMDGCTLAVTLRGENPTLPVLLMSGYCEDEPQDPRCQFPMLEKPFSIASLVRAVRELLQESGREPNLAHIAT